MRKPSKAVVIRTSLLVLALINNGLALAGKSPLPFDDQAVTDVVSYGFTVTTALLAWWKDNKFVDSNIIEEKEEE